VQNFVRGACVNRAGIASSAFVTERVGAADTRLHDVRWFHDSARLLRDNHVDCYEQTNLRHTGTGFRLNLRIFIRKLCWYRVGFYSTITNRTVSSSWGNPPRIYGTSPGIWDHTVACHPTQVNAPRLTPARKAGTRFTYPEG